MSKPRTPKFVLELIETERWRAETEAANRLIAERKQDREWAETGLARATAYMDRIVALLPPRLHRYVSHEIDEQTMIQLGRYPNQEPSGYRLEIPGLAPIGVQLYRTRSVDQPSNPTGVEHLNYTVKGTEKPRYASDDEPEYDRVYYHETNDLGLALTWAQGSATKMAEALAYHKKLKLEAEQEVKRRAEQEADYRRREVERLAQQAIADQAEQDETAKLLAAIRNDPVAVLMLKAFLALTVQRQSYAHEIENWEESAIRADEAANEQAARAAKASREAREAWQSAEDAKRQASDAEDELRREKRKHRE